MRTFLYCLALLLSAPAFAQRAPQLPTQPTIIRLHCASPVNDSTAPLVVLDTFLTRLDHLVLDPASIESINVLKDKKAIEKWGERAKGGVIVITPTRTTRMLTLYALYDHYTVPAGHRQLRVCINEKPVDHPELILVDLTAIDGISTFVSTNWNNPSDPKSETFFNITPRKGPMKRE